MSIDEILNFLKGFVPGYAAIENLVAPVFGSDVWDYGQCRALCGSSPAAWPAAVTTCNSCVDKIMIDALTKLIPELAGTGVGGAAIALSWAVVKEALMNWLEKKGLTWLTTKAIPIFGWICLIGDIANVIVLIISLKNVMNAADAAKKKFCVCP
jgi:hypothetical protein